MANISIGGDASRYMEAPTLSVGGGGNGSGAGFIASILDALGIGRQVAKPPKGASSESQTAQTPATQLPALQAASQAFTPLAPLPQTFGENWMRSIQPLDRVDPTNGGPSLMTGGFGFR